LAIDLTTYEKRSLYRFLALYLGSILILLSVIGYLFYEHSASVIINKIKFEMLYNTRIIETRLIRIEQSADGNVKITKNIIHQIQPLDYKIGIFDKKLKPIYSEIGKKFNANKEFYSCENNCFSVIKRTNKSKKIGYIVLKNEALAKHLRDLKVKVFTIIGITFLFAGAVGYFLSKLFLRPVREKIDALDRFIEDTTHELNTPISAILMTINTLKCQDQKKLNRLKISAARLSTMYESLSYNLSKDVEQTKEKFDLKELIENRVEFLKILAESKRVTFDCKLEPLKLFGIKEDFKKLIDNLLTNAIKYNEIGGKIEITLQEDILKICDSGIGIKKEQQKDIFKRYNRLNKERGGFGIGLSIVADIAKKYNLDIKVSENSPKGSCFSIDFTNNTH
jgi:two-component system OmpR family sensor kinase